MGGYGAKRGLVQHGFCVSGRTVRIETFEQLINFGAGRQFTVSKAHQRKARNRYSVIGSVFEDGTCGSFLRWLQKAERKMDF